MASIAQIGKASYISSASCWVLGTASAALARCVLMSFHALNVVLAKTALRMAAEDMLGMLCHGALVPSVRWAAVLGGQVAFWAGWSGGQPSARAFLGTLPRS